MNRILNVNLLLQVYINLIFIHRKLRINEKYFMIEYILLRVIVF